MKLIGVPAGAFDEARRAGVHVDVRREHVRPCRRGFVAVGGVIWMFASTNVLTASPELRPVPSVSTVNGAGAPTGERRATACAGDLARRRRVEDDRALPVRVGVRAALSCRCRSRVTMCDRAVRVGQREVDVLAGGGHERAGARVLLQRDRERVRLADSFVAFGVIEIFALTNVLTASPLFSSSRRSAP